jgi:hypothetical protein
MEIGNKKLICENRMKEIESEINILIQQRNQIDQKLNKLNIEALKIQGQLELMVELEDGK